MNFIDDILARRESETLEFKERFSNEVIETAVAFANTRGGQILLGVSDNGRVNGQRFGKEALRDYVNRIATATEPVVIPAAESHATPEGEIITLQINEVPPEACCHPWPLLPKGGQHNARHVAGGNRCHAPRQHRPEHGRDDR